MARKKNTVVCGSCGNLFETGSNNRKHCSPECKVKAVSVPFSSEKDECWNWPLALNPRTGYGQFSFHEHGKHALKTAHVYSYRAFIGDTAGLHVLHKCDNPSCFNPAHLFLGTPQDNMVDMVSKGRRSYETAVRGDRHGARLHPERMARGERHGGSKLTEQDVMYARLSTATSTSIAKELGVCLATICCIRKGRTWKHLILAS